MHERIHSSFAQQSVAMYTVVPGKLPSYIF